MTISLLVPSQIAPSVIRRLRKLAKNCGVDLIQVGGTTTLVRDKELLSCCRITVGDMPRESGYAFVARLEHLKEGNVVTRAPGEYTTDLEESWRTMSAKCQHCNTQRHRKETFILRTPTGELCQRNCLADFVCGNATSLLRLADLSHEVGDCMSEERWGSYRWDVSPVAFMACAASAIDAEGFRKSGEERPTKDTATFISGPRPKETNWIGAKYWDELQPQDHHVELAKATVAWLANHEVSGNSEYVWNLRLCIAEPDIGKHAGLLASATVAYQRHLGQQIKLKIDRDKPSGPAQGYAAPVKEVFEGEVVLMRVFIFPTDNSRWQASKTIVTFRSAGGHELVWFSTGKAPTEIGERYLIKGRVKKHETYRGIDQTVLQRVIFKEAGGA